MALATKRGKTPKSRPKGAALQMMGMSETELEKMASVKHKRLPARKRAKKGSK